MADFETAPLVMPAPIHKAAIEGNWNVLQSAFEVLQEEQNATQITVDLSDSAGNQIGADLKLDIRCATRFGDTLLHVLVTNEHNELASLVFRKDASLLKAHNKLLETPLHSAAKVGNVEFLIKLIRLAPSKVKDVLGETNYHGKTASYIAVKHGHEHIFHELMNLDRTTVCKEGLSLLHLAILKGCTSVVDALLNYNPDLAYHQESSGSFPIHLTAHAQNVELVLHFLKYYPDSGGLLNSAGQNVFHIAAEKNLSDVFTKQFKLSENSPHLFKMVSRMVNATDNEGNTPLHIAAMKGCRSIMLSISEANEKNNEQYLQRNYKGLTPFDLSVMQIKAIKGDNCNNELDQALIRNHISKYGPYFNPRWFNRVQNNQRMNDVVNATNKIQNVGLSSVLITTVTFAAAFTLPGGYDSVKGTPNLARRYAFKAFILADIVAFMHSALSVFCTTWSIFETGRGANIMLEVAAYNFLSAGASLVLAFGLALYVVLFPINNSIAIFALAIALMQGLPSILIINGAALGLHFSFRRIIKLRAPFKNHVRGIIPVVVSFMFIFLFAFL